MATLVVAVQTVGEPWEALPPDLQATLTEWCYQQLGDDERALQRALARVKATLGRSPGTGFIASLGVYDVERGVGTIYYQGAGLEEDVEVGAFTYRGRSETALLAEFWEGIQHYDKVVTYGGRASVLPFILHRSMVGGVRPTLDLLRYRYVTQQVAPYHIDLQDEYTFYGAMKKRLSLPVLCRMYGVPAPHLRPDECTTLFYAQQSYQLAEETARVLVATAALYERWRVYLAPPLLRALDPDIVI